MAQTTADGLYSYSKMVNNHTLLEHARYLNEYLERLNGWPDSTREFERGRWCADINVSRIAYTLDHMKYSTSSMEALVHEGWAKCYMYWFMNTPWKTDYNYRKPNRGLKSRNKYDRALTNYDNLDRYQKVICEQIVNYIKMYCIE